MRCLSYSISFPYTIEILDHHLCHLHDKKTQKNKKTFFFFALQLVIYILNFIYVFISI